MKSKSKNQIKLSPIKIKATNNVLLKNFRTLYIALHVHRTHRDEPITFAEYPYLVDMYKDQTRKQVSKKSTQSGVSELLLIKAIARSSDGKQVFYVLPKGELKTMFVQERFNKSIDYTKWYKVLTRQMDRRMAESTSLKHIGNGTIFFTSSKTASSFTSFSADDVLIDEWDSCDQTNIKMAPERQSASKDPMTHIVGNPTIEDFGIDAHFKLSNKQKWHTYCNHCRSLNQPNWFKHVLRQVDDNEYIVRDPDWERFGKNDIQLICEHCNKPFYRYNAGEWIAEAKANISGREINKLFSSRMRIEEMLTRFEKGLLDQEEMQRFWNGDMGIAYTASGSKITFEMLDACLQDYFMPEMMPKGSRCVMGADIGNDINVKINQLLPDGKARSVCIMAIPLMDSAAALDHAIMIIKELYKRYRCICGVVDAGPELRLSRALAYGIKGMFRWYHGDDKKNPVDIEAKKVHYDRNLLLDEVKANIVSEFIILPKNARTMTPLTDKGVSQYYDQLNAPTRVVEEVGRSKQKKYVWRETRADHYAFAEGYALLAKKIIASVG